MMPDPFTAQDRRRHRVFDALFKGLERCGVSVSQGERRELLAVVAPDRLEFQRRFKQKQVRRPLTEDEKKYRSAARDGTTFDLAQTDVLTFEFKTWPPHGLQRVWTEGKAGTMEVMLQDILITMIAAFPLMAAERERRQEAERQRRIAQQPRDEEVQRRKLDEDRFRQFLEVAAQWREAEVARAFLETLRQALPDAAPVAGTSVIDWLDWVEERLSRHDPLSGNPREVFVSLAALKSGGNAY